MGFALCLRILFAPCGYRRAYCGRESARVLASLFGSSPSGVRHLSRVCSSVWGPVGVAHPFHPSLLLDGVLVRLCGGPCWRSLAMSWVCPPPFLCIGLVCRSRSQCRPSHAVSLLMVSVLCERKLLRRGVSPCVGFCRSPWGSRWLHLYRLTPVLVGLRNFAVRQLVLRSVFHTFPVRRSACIHGDHFVSFTDLFVSQPKQSLRVVLFGHLQWWVTGLTLGPPPCTSRTLSIALTYGPDSQILKHPAIDIVVVALSSSLEVAMTPCFCGALGGLSVLVGSLTSPSPGRMLGPSWRGHLTWRVTRLTSGPTPRTSRTLSIALTAGQDS